jgi:hypothetical protein
MLDEAQLQNEYVFALPARLARKLLHLTAETGDATKAFALSQRFVDFTGATREAAHPCRLKHKGIAETGRH